MTSATPDPSARNRISSTPVLRAALVWGMVVGVVVAAAMALVGGLLAGPDGAWSGVLGALVGIVFPAFTALSILLGNHWYGHPQWLQIFFAVVMGTWLLKFVLVIVALLLLFQVEWLERGIFALAVIVAAVASLVVDLVVLSRMRLSGASDVTLPTADSIDD
ncbi:hypothetical protein [Microbacterium oleivorans]|uniref:ATP synthase protein I n=1 Tax=Microbacterium oleivorans TaxID=273677 RepID=A0A7D5EZX3_9MICO|nr:hypothetical protein [Microbacterium oleivorans]QLD12668.1 hypothetical protein HW566_13330 [Microbacterium oleivorans]